MILFLPKWGIQVERLNSESFVQTDIVNIVVKFWTELKLMLSLYCN